MPCLAITDSEIERCFHVLAELRPHLMQDEFLATVRAMEEDGFRLAFIEQDAEVVAAAGYRIYSNLFMGKHCYVDDLVTAEAQRSKGFGQQMIDWLRAEAQVAGCKWFHLDSGTQRDQAHKFYFAQGFTIASYHFSEELAQ
mgnify:CR=1 FL=1